MSEITVKDKTWFENQVTKPTQVFAYATEADLSSSFEDNLAIIAESRKDGGAIDSAYKVFGDWESLSVEDVRYLTDREDFGNGGRIYTSYSQLLNDEDLTDKAKRSLRKERDKNHANFRRFIDEERELGVDINAYTSASGDFVCDFSYEYWAANSSVSGTYSLIWTKAGDIELEVTLPSDKVEGYQEEVIKDIESILIEENINYMIRGVQ